LPKFTIRVKESFVLLGSIGIGLISAGIVTLSAAAERKANDAKAITLALSIGATIVGYSLVDKMGVRYINPVVYTRISQVTGDKRTVF
jgi:hypothetical protein